MVLIRKACHKELALKKDKADSCTGAEEPAVLNSIIGQNGRPDQVLWRPNQDFNFLRLHRLLGLSKSTGKDLKA